jgi:Phycobilisome degradation protein nblA
MNQSTSLSIEQEFQLKSFADQVKRMSQAQAQEFLIELHRQMMIREKIYQHLIQQEWNLNLNKSLNEDETEFFPA